MTALAAFITVLVIQCVLARDLTCNTDSCTSCHCTARSQWCGGIIVYPKNLTFRSPSKGKLSCLNCQWVISSLFQKRRLKLTFTQFYLGPGDTLRFYDGWSDTSRLIVTYKENDRPVSLVSSGDTMTVIMNTDKCGQDSSIRAFLDIIDSGKLFYLPRGKKISKQIRSLNFPRPYPRYLKCLWMFVRGSGLLLSADITIKSINTAGPKDKLTIQESIVRSRSNRGVHTFYGNKTGKNKKIKIRNSLGFTIMFSSDSVKKGKGFSLSVISLHQGNLLNNVSAEFV
ncbi:cubilin-like [Corticium candelabrum]|uniref:cubilin-like n=1 Tax=Corticium candelabrum TaxID=121492 RepID=UPI002E25CAC8|nr:cubilin-like [Corticium candelabrum]